MALERLRGLLGRETVEDYVADLEDDDEITVGVGTAVSRYTGPFATPKRPLQTATLYAEIEAGDEPYREEVGSFLMEEDGAYLSDSQQRTHERLQDEADALVEDWTELLDEHGLDYDVDE